MFSKRSKEIDPLLPQNERSPEITDYGTAPNLTGSSEIRYGGRSTYEQDNVNMNDATATSIANLRKEQDDAFAYQSQYPQDSSSSNSPRSSAWGTTIAFLTFSVFLALVLFASKVDDNAPRKSPLIPVPSHPSNLTLDDRVTKILTSTPLLDGHNDLAFYIRAAHRNAIHSESFRSQFEHGGLSGDVDLPRLATGHVGGAFWSAFVLCPVNASTDFSDQEYATAVSETLQQIDLIKRLQNMYPGKFTKAGSNLADMLSRFHSTKSMFGPISIEGLHQVPQSTAMATIRLYYELGVRAATLTWNCHNAFADAALIFNGIDKPTTYAGYHRGGLTKAGRDLVHEMNRLGMLVDVSHTSYWTQKAVLSDGTSRAPVIFSHSSAYALCSHPRNVKDDILELVKETKSLVQVNFSPGFISCVPDPKGGEIPEFYNKNNTLHQVARHIVYIGEKIGFDHVGLGSDYDGMGDLKPIGLEGVDKFPDLVKELLRLGVSDADAEKVVGGNVLRVWRAVEEVARNLQRDGEREGEDEVGGFP